MPNTDHRQLAKERGTQAEFLLQNSMFAAVVSAVYDSNMEESMQTQPHEEDRREHLYRMNRALNDIVGLLGQWVDVRDNIHTEEQLATQDEHEGTTTYE